VQVESDGACERVYGRRVTLASGAIGSPAILMHSGIGPTAALLEMGIEPVLDLPGVGAGLTHHPVTRPWRSTARARGRVSLASRDPRVQPVIELSFAADPEDMRRLMEGVGVAWQIAQPAGDRPPHRPREPTQRGPDQLGRGTRRVRPRDRVDAAFASTDRDDPLSAPLRALVTDPGLSNALAVGVLFGRRSPARCASPRRCDAGLRLALDDEMTRRA
jgi:GMC oxidoreductase